MYNKLFTKILDSSIWLESTPTRIVWLTFIAVMDEHGFVQFASVANVAHRARVTLEEAGEAILTLESPDADSSDPEFEGRRVERVPGGWMVFNAKKHRDMVTRAIVQEKTRERVRRHRERKRKGNAAVTQSEAVTETSTETATTPPLVFDSFVSTLLAKVPERSAWQAEINAMLEGMPGHHHATPEQIETAAKDMLANGVTGRPNLRQFRRYVDGAKPEARKATAHNGKGSTTRAMRLIALIRDRRNPLHPNSVVAEWQEGLSPADVQVCKTFGLTRILNDQNEGTVVAQLARALEESA